MVLTEEDQVVLGPGGGKVKQLAALFQRTSSSNGSGLAKKQECVMMPPESPVEFEARRQSLSKTATTTATTTTTKSPVGFEARRQSLSKTATTTATTTTTKRKQERLLPPESPVDFQTPQRTKTTTTEGKNLGAEKQELEQKVIVAENQPNKSHFLIRYLYNQKTKGAILIGLIALLLALLRKSI